MTHVMNIFGSSLNSNRKLKYFSVEVITFDGESYTEEVEVPPRKHRKSQHPSTTTSITRWFRAASHTDKSFLPQRAGCPPGQPFSLLIIASGFLRCLTALRLRLYAVESGQTLRKIECSGQVPVGHPS